MTYIKDLIELPDRVRRGDFVLRLTEGITKPAETVANYVVTPQLVRCFDEALSLIRSAIESHSSKAAYLHGSFGSGKSHFMAVLNLLLQGNRDARQIPELASVVARHNPWTEGRKFLLVPYHMIGALDMESAILGGYADHIRRLHPDAPTPGVYRSEEIFRDAENLRAGMGDAAFFARLNESVNGSGGTSLSGASSGWGDLRAGWEAASFEAAIAAPPKADDRVRLVGDLINCFFTAARSVQSGQEFVRLDDGLSIISRHAKSLGYDALILFLDELILWLATRAGDVAFVNREGPKLSKLVEAQTADRPAPLVSFVARQRDLRELVGENLPGAERLGFSDILKHWEARFTLISLEDRNLPVIAEKRILKPKSEAARQEMDAAFHKLEGIRKETMDVLLTNTSDPQTFRRIYPFSPALVETLVAASSLLQRERTALKLMLQLLVEQRDTLKLGDLVPVGDLFDVISEGDEAFSDVMKNHFENAKRLYEGKLRPLIEHEHKLRFEEMDALPAEDQRAAALRNDGRLLKTVLLAALDLNIESLRGLTPARLAALNHGTIKSPVPGREGALVLGKFKRWAAEVGQIKIGEPPHETISMQLTGVDTESIISQAQAEDNTGNRIRKIKELLFKELGISAPDGLFLRHEFMWRATKRSCEVTYANVRELPDAELRPAGDDWRIVIDFPFDPEAGHTPKSDLTRLERFRHENDAPARTLAWIPSFLSPSVQRDLGTLVILDHILTGERFGSYVSHLPPIERSDARTLLENQQSQLRQRVINFLEGAYAITTPAANSVDTTYEFPPAEHFQALDESFNLRPPVGANLRQAFAHLLDQALSHQYPAHPQFDSDLNITLPICKRVLAEIERATREADGRIIVPERERRKELLAIASPLRLGEMAENYFILNQDWQRHFLRKEAEHGGPMTVARLRQWIDEPNAMGLPKHLQNLIVLAFAAATNRSFFQYNTPVEVSLENLPDNSELREQRLPRKASGTRCEGVPERSSGLTARRSSTPRTSHTSSPMLKPGRASASLRAINCLTTSSRFSRRSRRRS